MAYKLIDYLVDRYALESYWWWNWPVLMLVAVGAVVLWAKLYDAHERLEREKEARSPKPPREGWL